MLASNGMKPLLILLTAVALAAGTATASRAEPPLPPSEKCDDLQNRCLHRENGICQIWHDECLIKHATSSHGGGHGGKKHSGRRHRV